MKYTSTLLCLAVLLVPQTDALGAPPPDVKQAEAYAAKAYDAYVAKQYADAVGLYLKAHKQSPSADILYNIAKIYDTKLKDRELAMTFYRRYIADPGADPDRMTEVNARLAELKEADAIAKAPASPKAPAPAAPMPPGSEPDGGWSDGQVAGLAMAIVGVAGIGVGAGFGVAALSKADRANELCDGDACTSQEGVDAAGTAETFATVSTLGIGFGAAVAVGGALLMLFSPGDDGAQDTSFTVVPLWGPKQGGLGVLGRF